MKTKISRLGGCEDGCTPWATDATVDVWAVHLLVIWIYIYIFGPSKGLFSRQKFSSHVFTEEFKNTIYVWGAKKKKRLQKKNKKGRKNGKIN